MMNLSPLSNEISRPAAAAELLRRRKARRDMLAFVQYTKADYLANWHHAVLCSYLNRFASGEIKRLMVFMGPQHGKSELVSRKLPAFILGQKPNTKIVAASYGASLAESMNRDLQRTIDSSEYERLFPETRLNGSNVRSVSGGYLRNSAVFQVVGHEGQYKCSGVGGDLTGTPGDMGIIDDPFKDYQEARSKTVRDAVWEWYTSVFLARTHRNSGILLMHTRWHEDDLAGRLLALEPHLWTVLSLPAICTTPNAPDEQRQMGEALWPARFDIDTLRARQAINPHQFEALYQQNPTPREGSFFKPDQIEIVVAAPAGLKIASAWDIGATEGDGDPTARVKMGTDGQGRFVILDAFAEQLGTDRRDARIKQTAALDGKTVPQRLPQDPGAAGKSQAAAFVKLLAGYTVKTLPVSGDKMTRADPFSSQVNAGNVSMVAGDWNAAFLEELRQFPNGKHDDLVDAASDAFDELSAPAPLPFHFNIR